MPRGCRTCVQGGGWALLRWHAHFPLRWRGRRPLFPLHASDSSFSCRLTVLLVTPQNQTGNREGGVELRKQQERDNRGNIYRAGDQRNKLLYFCAVTNGRLSGRVSSQRLHCGGAGSRSGLSCNQGYEREAESWAGFYSPPASPCVLRRERGDQDLWAYG